jgi:hypothetical protein
MLFPAWSVEKSFAVLNNVPSALLHEGIFNWCIITYAIGIGFISVVKLLQIGAVLIMVLVLE